MKLTLDYLSQIFNRVISRDENYQEALNIIRKNSRGKIWFIGGSVYRSLVKELYGIGKVAKDFDFIVENAVTEIVLPSGYEMKTARFGNPKFVKRDIQIDFVPLDKVVHIVFYNMPRTIISFLRRVPFNIHSIAYDVRKKRVIGKLGREALEERVVRVNDFRMARIYVEKYGTTINDKIRKIAEELGFRAEFP